MYNNVDVDRIGHQIVSNCHENGFEKLKWAILCAILGQNGHFRPIEPLDLMLSSRSHGHHIDITAL